MRSLRPALLVFVAACAGAPKGDRAEDYFPLREPWTGVFKSGDREPELLVVRHAAPRGKVWLIDVSHFYTGGQYGLLVTDEERGLLLHAVYLGGGVAKLDPPQVLLPRSVPEGAAWRNTASARGDREVEVEILGQPLGGPVSIGGRSRRTRRLEVRLKFGTTAMSFDFQLAPGEGVVRFEGGAGDRKGEWLLSEVRPAER